MPGNKPEMRWVVENPVLGAVVLNDFARKSLRSPFEVQGPHTCGPHATKRTGRIYATPTQGIT